MVDHERNMTKFQQGFGPSDAAPETFQFKDYTFTCTFVLAISLLLLFVAPKFVINLLYRARQWLWRTNKDGLEDNPCSLRGLEAIPQMLPMFPWAFIGNLPAIMPITKTMANFDLLSRKYGDAVKYTALNKTIVVLNTGPLAQTLLRSTDLGHGIKEPIIYDMFKPYINGLLVSSGKLWQTQRKILMRTQTFPSLKANAEMLNRHSARFVKELGTLFQDNETHPINEEINTVFLKIINEMVTGCDMECSAEFNEYHYNFQIFKECIVRRFFNPLLFFNATWKFHPMSRKFSRVVHELFEFTKRRITDYRENHRNAEKGEDSGKFKSVLDELMEAGVDEDQMIDEMNTMLFAGHETGASTMHCFCFMMALHPNIQKECRKEIDELFHESCDREEFISYESVQGGLKYLERCLLETLRLFPPAFVFLRKLTTPLDIEYAGEMLRLPVGTATAVFPWCIHRKEEYYPEPGRFDPNRFLPEEQAKRHAYSFLAFSGGPRNCLGMKFAMMEMKIVAAYLLRNFEMDTTDKLEDINFLPYITLTPERDFTFKFKKRVTNANE